MSKEGRVVNVKTALTPREQIKDVLGKPVAQSVYNDMERRHKIFNGKDATKDASKPKGRGGPPPRGKKKEASAAEGVDSEADDEDECDSMEVEELVEDEARFPESTVTFYTGSIELECDEVLSDEELVLEQNVLPPLAAAVPESQAPQVAVPTSSYDSDSTMSIFSDGVEDESEDEMAKMPVSRTTSPMPSRSPPPSPPATPPMTPEPPEPT